MKTTPQAIKAMAESEGDCYPRKDVRKMRKRIMKAKQETENEFTTSITNASTGR